jgi:hypothetical protein
LNRNNPGFGPLIFTFFVIGNSSDAESRPHERSTLDHFIIVCRKFTGRDVLAAPNEDVACVVTLHRRVAPPLS